MAIQNVDLSLVTSATYDGNDLSEIILDGQSIWTSGPISYTSIAFGPSYTNWPNNHGYDQSSGTQNYNYNAYGSTHTMVNGEVLTGGGLIFEGYENTGDNIPPQGGLYLREYSGLSQSEYRAFAINEDGILHVYITNIYAATGSPSWAVDLYGPNGSEPASPYATPGLQTLNYSDIAAKVNAEHKGLRFFKSSSDPDDLTSHQAISALSVKPQEMYSVRGVNWQIPDISNTDTCLHIGYYDNTGTFIVDDIYDTPKVFQPVWGWDGQYGPNWIVQPVRLTKTASNTLKFEVSRNLEGVVNGDLPSVYRYGYLSGPINGNHPNTSDAHFNCLYNNGDCPDGLSCYSGYESFFSNTNTGSVIACFSHRTRWINGKLRIDDPTDPSKYIDVLEFPGV